MAYSHTRYTVAHSVPDQDGDEFGAHEDCNDNDPAIHPRAVEVVADGIDQNCDGAERCYADQDWDGFLPREPREKESDDLDCDDPGEGDSASPRGDCDDRNPRTFPGADEVVGDEVDQDCDGIEVCFVDDDGDGWRTEESRVGDDRLCDREGEAAASQPAGDCDDGSADIRPGAEDLVDDGIDQDCDGEDSISPPPAAPESPPSSGCSTASAAPPPWTWLALVIAVVAGRTRLMNRAEPASDT